MTSVFVVVFQIGDYSWPYSSFNQLSKAFIVFTLCAQDLKEQKLNKNWRILTAKIKAGVIFVTGHLFTFLVTGW